MSAKHRILVLGSGALAFEVTRALSSAGFSVKHLAENLFRDKESTLAYESGLAYAKRLLERHGAKECNGVFVVDAKDRVNVHLLLATQTVVPHDTPVMVSFLNDNFRHLADMNGNIHVVNPAECAAAHFVRALDATVSLSRKAPVVTRRAMRSKLINGGILKPFVVATAAFMAVLVLGSTFFSYTEGKDWLDALYTMVTIATSVSLDPVSISNLDWKIKLGRIALMIFALFYTAITLGTVASVFESVREKWAHGARPFRMREHVILCGLGKLGFKILEQLLARGERVIVIEENERDDFLGAARARGVPVIIGNATLEHHLGNANVERAKALIAAVNDDAVNGEIALNTSPFNPHLRLILRIFDSETATLLREKLGLEFALSMPAIAAARMREVFMALH